MNNSLSTNYMNLDMNSSLNASSIGGLSTAINYCYENWYTPYWHSCYHSEPSQNKFESAFKIVSKLLELKIIEKMTLKQFIETVTEVTKLV